MKVAIVYDRVNKWGGAERILLSLHKLFPNAPLYTSVYDEKKAPWAKVFRIHTSFLQHIPFAKSHHEYLAMLMPLAFASFSFKKYDLVISVTSEYAKGIIVSGKTKHICLCLTPTRYLWSGYSEYFQNTSLKILAKPVIFLLRLWDKKIAELPDFYIAISKEVQKRIKKYYKRDSVLVYPPVIKLPNAEKNSLFEKNYLLVVSRLSRFTSYKRIDLAVRAATKINASLIVVGDGNNGDLKKIAGPNVQFVGKVSDEKLSLYYDHAQALIFPGNEDFGITMVEALSFGKPVIAYKAGGALEIVKEGKTGTFFSKQSAASLVKVLKSFKASTYNRNTCSKTAAEFSEKIFLRKMKKIISEIQHL